MTLNPRTAPPPNPLNRQTPHCQLRHAAAVCASGASGITAAAAIRTSRTSVSTKSAPFSTACATAPPPKVALPPVLCGPSPPPPPPREATTTRSHRSRRRRQRDWRNHHCRRSIRHRRRAAAIRARCSAATGGCVIGKLDATDRYVRVRTDKNCASRSNARSLPVCRSTITAHGVPVRSCYSRDVTLWTKKIPRCL